MSKHTIPPLPQRGIEILRELMNKSGWTKSIDEIVRAGELLANIIPEPPEKPVEPVDNLTQATLVSFRADVIAWGRTKMPAFELTEKQRDAIKSCVKFCAEKGMVPAEALFAPVLRAFGFGDSAE